MNAAFWSAVPALAWVSFLSVTTFVFRADIREIVRSLRMRVQRGAAFRVAGVEIGAVVALPSHLEKTQVAKTFKSDDGRRRTDREVEYARCRRAMLVHKLLPSSEEGELYDILIYVIPAFRGSLAGLQRVEYYFGGYGWKERIFVAADRSRGFPVLTAAYGPFLCSAEFFFNDSTSVVMHRYIDFEMGNCVVAPIAG